MRKDKNQNFIDTIVAKIKNNELILDEDVATLLDIYEEQKAEILRLEKQNNFFIKEWDRRNLKEHEKNAKKDKLLEQQSKMAAMGEMMDAVAHQWKQPLNSIAMMTDMLKTDFENGIVDKKYIEEMTYTENLQIDHMINTLNEFRNFFRPLNDNEKLFYLSDCITSVQILMKDELISHNVNMHINIEHQLSVFGLQNEFKHLFINLINNSIDAFDSKQQNRDIFIRAYNRDSYTFIEFEDNAGGISKDVIKDVFKPNITTKQKENGTGIGLYMSSQIVQKNHGSIDVHNSEKGAFFTITLHTPTATQLKPPYNQ